MDSPNPFAVAVEALRFLLQSEELSLGLAEALPHPLNGYYWYEEYTGP